MTGLPPATTGRGQYQNYTEAERMSTMLLALQVGVAKAADATDTPTTTIYSWFQDAGGVAKVRAVSSETVMHAQQRASTAVYEAIRLKAEAGEMTADQLLQAHTAQVNAAAVVAKAQAPGRTDGPSAHAAAIIQVQIKNDDGSVDLLEVPRDRPALAQPAAPDPPAA